MATKKQVRAAKENIRTAQQVWQSMTPRARSLAQPQGRKRAKVGSTGQGAYYRVEVRPKGEFATFRYHDVGEKGEILRLAGKRSSGSWADVAWLINKHMAHVTNGILVGDEPYAKEVLKIIGPARHAKGDIFKGYPRKNVPESEKPTYAMKRARKENVRKAQEARFLHH